MVTHTAGSDFDDALLAHLRRLIGDPSELSSFRHWFTRALWDAESTASDDILSLAYGIENLIGVLDSGRWTEPEFLDAVRTDLAAYEARMPQTVAR